MLLENILGSLFIAWLLAWLGFDNFILGVINGFFGTHYDSNTYYMAAIVIGIIYTVTVYNRWW